MTRNDTLFILELGLTSALVGLYDLDRQTVRGHVRSSLLTLTDGLAIATKAGMTGELNELGIAYRVDAL